MLIPLKKPLNKAKNYLICFPHAGGLASSFFPLAQTFHAHYDLEILSFEYSGRGKRAKESLNAKFTLVFQEIVACLKNYLDPEIPIVFFGHSMGSLFAYESTFYFEKTHLIKSLCVSSKHPPFTSELKNYFSSDMHQHEFSMHIQKMKGIPAEISAQKEILNYFLPIIRNDFELILDYETNHLPSSSNKVTIPISLFYGNQDISLQLEKLILWETLTTTQCLLYPFAGGHFYHRSPENLKKLNLQISKILGCVLNLDE